MASARRLCSVSKVTRRAIALVLITLVSACNIAERRADVSAQVRGTDGTLTADTPITLTLTHRPDSSPPGARLTTASGGLQNVTDIRLSVSRSGFPIDESFYLLNLTRSSVQPENNDINVAAAGPRFVPNRIGDLARAAVDTNSLDSPLNDAFTTFPPVGSSGSELLSVRTHSASWLSRIELDDPRIPFVDTTALIDMRRLVAGLESAVASGVSAAAARPDAPFRLSGADSAGDLRTFFIPNIRHSTFAPPARNVKGFGLVIALTIDALDPFGAGLAIGTMDVYIPISILFEPDEFSEAPYSIIADPFSMIGSTRFPPDNINRIYVAGRGGLIDSIIVTEARNSIIAALSALPQSDLDTIDLVLNLLAAVIDAELPESADAVPDDFDVVLLPEGPLPTVRRNRIGAVGNGVPVRLYFLQ